jgi:hypothetical protein
LPRGISWCPHTILSESVSEKVGLCCFHSLAPTGTCMAISERKITYCDNYSTIALANTGSHFSTGIATYLPFRENDESCKPSPWSYKFLGRHNVASSMFCLASRRWRQPVSDAFIFAASVSHFKSKGLA